MSGLAQRLNNLSLYAILDYLEPGQTGSMVFRTLIFALVIAGFGLVIMGCSASVATQSKPTVIIASPPSGSVYTVGEKVVIQSTATDPSGVTRVTLLVNGAIISDDPSPVPQGQAQFSLIQTWTAESAGEYVLTVRATNAQGATSDSGIIINVRDQGGGPEPPTVVAIATAVPIATATPVATGMAQTDVPPVTVIVTATPAASQPTAPPSCVLNSQFVADVTIPDGMVFTPNAVFAKTWRVRNNGTCAWENFGLVFVSGTQMAASSIFPVPTTPPGATADLVVPMTAPASYGNYAGTWRLRSAAGQLFGTNLTVVISVPSPATPVPPTNTPPPTAAGCAGKPDDFTFTVSDSDITAGQSVTLGWGPVTNASEVRLDGGEFSNEGVETPGNRVVSPGATTHYELTAKCNNSGQVRDKTVTVNVGAPVGNFAGNWVMNFGNMNLTQDGNAVTGTYNNLFGGTSGSIAGSVDGNEFVGTWSIVGNSGDVELTLSNNGQRFTGSWGGGANSWCGARPGQNFPNGCSFAGEWQGKNSVFADCPMTLTRRDNIITGNYCNGTIQGSVDYLGSSAVATGNWDTGGSIGEFKFYLDGYNAYKFNGNFSGIYEWCGWRSGQSAPVPCHRP